METLRYVVLVNALLAVVSFAYYVLLRRETFFRTNRLVLWLGLAATLLLPLLELPDWRPQPVRTVMHRTAQVIVPKLLSGEGALKSDVTITFPNQKTYPAFRTQPTESSWSWARVLLLVYGFGVAFLLIRLGLQLSSLRRLIRQSVLESYVDFTLVRNETITSPFSFFNWVVLNPDRHTDDELEQILRHERVHVRERHSLDMLGAELVCILFWFNPAAYLFRHLLHQTLEFSADQTVLAEGIDAKAYQYNLMKVSLSAGQSTVTNHFSKSQLKSRIVMLNKPASPKTNWLKYPVFFIAALMIASAFAQPQIRKLNNHLPTPLAKGITSVLGTPRVVAGPSAKPELFPEAAFVESKADKRTLQQVPAKSQQLPLDSTNHKPRTDAVRVSPSRYMVYKDDYLYWIVTPKTTFDDFAVMKKEFEKYGNIMQLNELKYDPLYTYIDRISFTVKRPFGSLENCRETADDAKPIPTIAGYVGIGPKTNYSSTASLRNYRSEFPETLRIIAAEEEQATDQFIRAHKPDYLIFEGEQKLKNLGDGGASYTKNYIRENPTQNNSGLIVNPDGSLSVNEELGNIQLFVNNEAIGRTALREIKVNQLFTVVQKSQYNPAKKEPFISALLIYTTEDN